MAYEQGGISLSPVKVMDNAMRAEANDPLVEKAKQQAKSTLPDFIKKVQQASPQHRNFSVMIVMPAADGAQGLWVHDVTYDSGQFTGVLTQLDANSAPSVMERTSVPADKVVDWFYLEGEIIVGSHLMHAMRQQLSASQRQLHDERIYANLGARFE